MKFDPSIQEPQTIDTREEKETGVTTEINKHFSAQDHKHGWSN